MSGEEDVLRYNVSAFIFVLTQSLKKTFSQLAYDSLLYVLLSHPQKIRFSIYYRFFREYLLSGAVASYYLDLSPFQRSAIISTQDYLLTYLFPGFRCSYVFRELSFSEHYQPHLLLSHNKIYAVVKYVCCFLQNLQPLSFFTLI